MLQGMKQILLISALGLAVSTVAAQAACNAEYKAKRDNPLELHYNVATIKEPCTKASARAQLEGRLAGQGIKLLKIMTVTKK